MSTIKSATRVLPAQPSLENLKKQARALLKEACAGDPQAQARVLAHHPALAREGAFDAARFTLNGAQLVVAREYGFASWPKLKAELDRRAAHAGLVLPAGTKLPLIVLREHVLCPYSTLHSGIVDAAFARAAEVAMASPDSYAFCVLSRVASSSAPSLEGLHAVGAIAQVEKVSGANGAALVRLRYRGRAQLTSVHDAEGFRFAEPRSVGEPRLSSADSHAALQRLYRTLEPLSRRIEWLPRAELARYKNTGNLPQLIAAAASECNLAQKQSLLEARDQRAMVERLCEALEPLVRVHSPPSLAGSAPPAAEPPACLVVLHADGHSQLLGRRYSLDQPSTRIGRAADASVLLPSSAVSRLHARIEREGTDFVLIDQGSMNGSFVGEGAEPVARHVLSDGEEFAIGDAILRFACGPDLRAKCGAAIDYIAEHDALTRAKRESAFRAEAERCVLRARGSEAALSLLLLEIDSLAECAEQNGSLVGNALLSRVAALLRTELPPNACVGRCAGDRLAVTLPELEPSQAWRIAEQLRSAIAQRPFVVSRKAVAATVSVGVSTLYRMTGAEELLSDASAALARAVDAGRNAVAGPSEEAAV